MRQLLARRASRRCDGVDAPIADGRPSGQDVIHVYLRVFPGSSGDGFRLDADWRTRPRPEPIAVAQQLRLGLAIIL